MNINLCREVLKALEDVPDVRIAVDYNEVVVDFLRKNKYGFYIQDSAFGREIVISDANHIQKVEKQHNP